MVDTVCIIEDIYYSKLLPLVYFRPVYDLRCGILTLKEKIQKYYSDIPLSLHCRSYLSDSVKRSNPNVLVNDLPKDIKSCLFINGRVIVDANFRDKVPSDGSDTLYVDGETIIAARVSGPNLDFLRKSMNDVFTISDFSGLLKKEIKVDYISYPWDLIKYNGKQLVSDFNLLVNKNENNIKGKIYEAQY